MKSRIFLLLLLLGAGIPLSATHIKLFIITGQSNSLGTTNGGEPDPSPGSDAADDNILFYWHNIAEAGIDIGDSGGEFLNLQAQQGGTYAGSATHWGGEMEFGRTLYRAGVRDFGIIKASRGGGGNTFWLKGSADDHMYDHVVNTVTAATTALTNVGHTFEIVGLLYLQGESDSGVEITEAGSRLKTLTDNLRADLPNAASLHTVAAGTTAAGLTSSANQQAIAGSTAYIDFFANTDLSLAPDNLHLDKQAKLTLGNRWALAFLNAGVVDRHYGKLVFIGDSITQGGNGNPSYRYQIFKNLANSGVPQDDASGYAFSGSQNGAYQNNPGVTPDVNGQTFQNVHEGHWGWRAFWINGRTPLPANRYDVNNLGQGTLENWTGQTSNFETANQGTLTYTGSTYTPDTAVIKIGINDLGDNTPATQVRDDIGMIIDQLRAANPKVRIHVSELLYTGAANAVSDAEVDAVNTLLPQLVADKNAASGTSPVWLIPTNDGYTLFNAKAPYSRENPVTGSTHLSPPGRDLVAEYADAARRHGLKVGYYYSLIDWQHPHATPNSRRWPTAPDADPARYVDYLHSHITQLFTEYGRADILWVDYSTPEFQGSSWRTRELLETLRRLQPHLILNNRFWNGLENGHGDFFTPEKYVPPTGYPGRIFEVCHTLNESFGFSYHDTHWKSTREVVHLLVDIVSKGGNLLLNVGPDPYGRIPAASVRALRETGQWLQTHGDAIYGTRAGPFAKLGPGVRCTHKTLENGTHVLYLHLLDWPENPQLALPGLRTPVTRATLMGPGTPLAAEKTEDGLTVRLPDTPANPVCSVVVLELAGPPEVDPDALLPRQHSDRSVLIPATQMTLRGPSIRITPENGDLPAHVSYWLQPADRVDLAFRVDRPGPVQPGGEVTRRPGRYAVILELAVAENSGGRLRLRTSDGQQIEADLHPTGSWQTYRRLKVGELTLSTPGRMNLSLTPAPLRPSGFMNLASITLEPLD